MTGTSTYTECTSLADARCLELVLCSVIAAGPGGGSIWVLDCEPRTETGRNGGGRGKR